MERKENKKVSKFFVHFEKLAILVIILAAVFSSHNINRLEQNNKVKAQAKAKESLTSVPSGYTGIYNASDLNSLNTGTSINGNYILMNDIDMSGVNFNVLPILSGIFEGNYHKISNLNINNIRNKRIGLFESINSNGQVLNLTLDNISISYDIKNSDNLTTLSVGSIAGEGYGKTENVNINTNIDITNSSTTFTNDIKIGGIIGGSSCQIENGIVNGEINFNGKNRVVSIGGLSGSNLNKIRNSYNNANINVSNLYRNGDDEGTIYQGGISGENKGVLLKYVKNSGNLVCDQGGSIYQGGLVGKQETGIIKDSYNTGNIKAIATKELFQGGIIGNNGERVNHTYSIGNIENNISTNIGGIAGNNIGSVESSYWYSANNSINSLYGTHKTLNELKQKATFEGWDFEKVWDIREGITTPTFKENITNNIMGLEDSYWEWIYRNTLTTPNDIAYKGKHIQILPKREEIKFYGYGQTAYKDYLYKDYSYPGKKTFKFTVDESKANYHTLDGAGFIFNANKVNNLLSGYILLIRTNEILIYRIDGLDLNKNIEQYKDGDGKPLATIRELGGTVIQKVNKTSDTIHNFIIEVTPTNVKVNDNGNEILNANLNYLDHVGESFGPIASYTQHDCEILSEITFSEFELEIEDYQIPVLKIDTKGNPLPGAKFVVKNAQGVTVREGITEENGFWNVENLDAGTYTLEEVTPPIGYVLNSTIFNFRVTAEGSVVDVNTGEPLKLIVENEKLPIIIKKYEQGTTRPVEGAVIGIYDKDGNEIVNEDGEHITAITNKNGEVRFRDLEEGTYKYKEIQAPEGYILNDMMYSCTINKDGSITYANGNKDYGIIYNEKIKASATIQKYEEGTTNPVAGAVIGIYDKDGNEILDENRNPIRVTTNANGQVKFNGLEEGTYKYKEIQAPEGYILNDTMYSFTVNKDGSITYVNGNKNYGIIYNQKIKASATIQKYEEGTTNPVAGAVIGIYDKDGNEILDENGNPIRVTTNANGQVKFNGLEEGTYKYKEIQAPEGYILNDTMYSFTVNKDGSITYENSNNNYGIIYNKKKEEEPEPVKKYEVTIKKCEEGSTRPVSGAVIGIYDKEGNEILDENGNPIRVITDINGQVKFNGVEAGTYKYKEIQAPEGYILNDTMYSFTIDENGNITFDENEGIIYNKKIKANITIKKYEEGSTRPVAGAVIGIYDEEGNEILDENGNPIRVITDEKGEVTFNGVEAGTYKYKEIQAPEGYILNNTMYSFTVDKKGGITFNNNEGIIYNKKKEEEPSPIKKYEVTIKKYEEGSTRPVAGAVIGIYDKEGNEILDENGKPIIAITNINGEAIFNELEVGDYKFKEIEAPEGYVLNNIMYDFTINEDGTITFDENEGIIYNKKIIVDVTIQKYEEGTTKPVEGAVIGIYDKEGNKILDANGNPITAITDKKGQVIFKGVEKGEYQYREIQAPNGYELNNTMYSFVINNDGQVIFNENNKGIIYNKKIEEIKGNTESNNVIKNNNTNILNTEIKSGQLPHTGKNAKVLVIITSLIVISVTYFWKRKYEGIE